MKKKYTIIIIGDQRRIFTREISTTSIIMTLSALAGLIFLFATIFMARVVL